MEQEHKKFWHKRWFKITAGVILFFFILAWFSDDSTPATSEPAPVQTTASAQPKPSDKVAVGEQGYINSPSPKAILANTKDGYKEIMQTYSANDMYGVQEFLLSGKGFAVAKGTKIQVVDTAVGARKVRVLDGEMTGQAGWIAMEWVSKNP